VAQSRLPRSWLFPPTMPTRSPGRSASRRIGEGHHSQLSFDDSMSVSLARPEEGLPPTMDKRGERRRRAETHEVPSLPGAGCYVSATCFEGPTAIEECEVRLQRRDGSYLPIP